MIKDLMVHLDGTRDDDARLLQAEALSATFDSARITGLFTNPLPEYAYVMGAQSGYGDAGPIIDLERELRREGTRIVERLTRRLLQPGASHEIRRVDAWPSQIPNLVVSQARCADLFIAGAPYRGTDKAVWDRLVEAVLFESGHGVVLVPPNYPVRPALTNILCAWDDSAPATRAISEALPILKRANTVRLLVVDTVGRAERGEQATDIAAHLDRHGVNVDIFVVRGDAYEVGTVVRREADRMSADMIVMGGYGHSRFREWVLGGATRDVCEAATIPVLLAH